MRHMEQKNIQRNKILIAHLNWLSLARTATQCNSIKYVWAREEKAKYLKIYVSKIRRRIIIDRGKHWKIYRDRYLIDVSYRLKRCDLRFEIETKTNFSSQHTLASLQRLAFGLVYVCRLVRWSLAGREISRWLVRWLVGVGIIKH